MIFPPKKMKVYERLLFFVLETSGKSYWFSCERGV